MPPPPDIDALSLSELKSLVLKLLEEWAEFQRTVGALRGEIARLRGGPGRPDIKANVKPSGMEKASEPRAADPSGERRRRGATRTKLSANKSELLRILERPDIALHINGSENDIPCQVTKRHISGGTRSDAGCDCRDALLGLLKTCAKSGIAFWDHLGARLAVPGCPDIPDLAQIVRDLAPTPPLIARTFTPVTRIRSNSLM
jgi:hypothetical protein